MKTIKVVPEDLRNLAAQLEFAVDEINQDIEMINVIIEKLSIIFPEDNPIESITTIAKEEISHSEKLSELLKSMSQYLKAVSESYENLQEKTAIDINNMIN